MRFWLTVTLLLMLIASAHRFGRSPERRMANLLGANFVLFLVNYILAGAPSFGKLNYTVAAIDGLTLVGFMWIALRANRMWPMVMTSLQMVVMITHASVLVSVGWTRVYYGMIALSQYCELITLAVGIAYHYVRERRHGPYREWRIGYEPPGLGPLSARLSTGATLPRSHDHQSAAINPASSW